MSYRISDGTDISRMSVEQIAEAQRCAMNQHRYEDDTLVTDREIDRLALVFVSAALISFAVMAWTIYGVVRITFTAFGG